MLLVQDKQREKLKRQQRTQIGMIAVSLDRKKSHRKFLSAGLQSVPNQFVGCVVGCVDHSVICNQATKTTLKSQYWKRPW